MLLQALRKIDIFFCPRIDDPVVDDSTAEFDSPSSEKISAVDCDGRFVAVFDGNEGN
jgi:hypothetical protein